MSDATNGVDVTIAEGSKVGVGPSASPSAEEVGSVGEALLISEVQAIRGEIVMIKKRVNMTRRMIFVVRTFVCFARLIEIVILVSRFCDL